MTSARTAASPLKTLLIAGAASAAAAIVIPMLWRPGTVFAAAMTPIVVALVTELLRRRSTRSGRSGAARPPRGTACSPPRRGAVRPARAAVGRGARRAAGDADAPPRAAPAPPADARQWKLGARHRARRVRDRRGGRVTASELVAGDAVSGGGAHHVLRRQRTSETRDAEQDGPARSASRATPSRPRRRRPRTPTPTPGDGDADADHDRHPTPAADRAPPADPAPAP